MNSPDCLPLGLLSLDTCQPLSPTDNLPRRDHHHIWNSLHPGGHSILLSELDLPPSPSDTCSSASTEPPATPSPRSHPVHIVCRAPLVAPIPLPYHSPTFLQFELPDLDQDLSHPPYTKRTPKRKREDELDQPPATKRRVSSQRSFPSPSEYAHFRYHTTTAVRRPKKSSHRHSYSLQPHLHIIHDIFVTSGCGSVQGQPPSGTYALPVHTSSGPGGTLTTWNSPSTSISPTAG